MEKNKARCAYGVVIIQALGIDLTGCSSVTVVTNTQAVSRGQVYGSSGALPPAQATGHRSRTKRWNLILQLGN